MSSVLAEGASTEVNSAGALPKLNVGSLIFLGALWAWAIFALSGYWRDFEQYSYGYFVPPLAAYFVWRRLALFASANPSQTIQTRHGLPAIAILTALAVLPLEYVRMALPASRQTVWIISLTVIAYTLFFAWSLGGRPLARKLAFPLFFFLSACPWFSFLEKNVTLGLMEYVAAIVTEILHLCGIHAKTKGTLIEMRAGVLGIAEACSGIRSLQSGLMYALAVGELFLLATPRRFALVALTVLAGFILNLVRTFILAYQTELHGVEIIAKIHDQVGVTTSLVLPVVVWGLGKLLAGPEPEPDKNAEPPGVWVRHRVITAPKLIAATAIAVAAFLPPHLWLAYQDVSVARQTKPYFIPRFDDPRNQPRKMPDDVAKELNATIGGYLYHSNPELPQGALNSYYLFWEPKKDNFNILWHHPERCMVGAGWKPNGPSQEIDVMLGGKAVRWLVFPFKNERGQVLQLWGAWRNGTPVVGNKANWTTLAGLKKQLRLFSKGNSATEIVSLSIPYSGDALPIAQAQAIVTQVYDYKGNLPN